MLLLEESLLHLNQQHYLCHKNLAHDRVNTDAGFGNQRPESMADVEGPPG